jgi:hypothetical protein
MMENEYCIEVQMDYVFIFVHVDILNFVIFLTINFFISRQARMIMSNKYIPFYQFCKSIDSKRIHFIPL